MRLEVIKINESPNSTLSQLLIDGKFHAFILEDGFRDAKVHGSTRIPDGTYKITARKEGRFYAKYKQTYNHTFVPWLRDVPGFEFILMHIGNYTKDTQGCLLVGDLPTWNGTDFEITKSTQAYLKFYAAIAPAILAGQEVMIELRRDK